MKSVVYESAALVEVSGKLVEQKSPGRSVTDYDAQGSATQEESYRNGKLTSRDVYLVVDGMRAVKSEDFSGGDFRGGGPGLAGTPDPRFTFKFSYQYDLQGNRIQETWTRSNGSIARKIYCKFDEQGRLLEEKIVSPRGGKPPEMVNKRLFTLDAQGNVSKAEMENVEISEFSDYQFDAQGNWIKRKIKSTVIYNPQKPKVNMSVVTRQITYY